METLVGKDNFRTILRKYIRTYFFKSIVYTDFIELFTEMIKNLYQNEKAQEILSKLHWKKWILEPGFPDDLKYSFGNLN